MIQRINKIKYITVFALTTLVFIIGIILGQFLSESKLTKIEETQENLKIYLTSLELQSALMSQNPCTFLDSLELNEELYEMNSRLANMEAELGKQNPEVLELKEYYSLLEIRHWLFTKKIKEECHEDKTIILFFYSNLGDCGSCDQQGFILSYLRKKYPQTVVYAFDINLKNPALNTVKQLYNIKTTPTLVIDDEVYEKFMDREEIQELILD